MIVWPQPPQVLTITFCGSIGPHLGDPSHFVSRSSAEWTVDHPLRMGFVGPPVNQPHPAKNSTFLSGRPTRFNALSLGAKERTGDRSASDTAGINQYLLRPYRLASGRSFALRFQVLSRVDHPLRMGFVGPPVNQPHPAKNSTFLSGRPTRFNALSLGAKERTGDRSASDTAGINQYLDFTALQARIWAILRTSVPGSQPS